MKILGLYLDIIEHQFVSVLHLYTVCRCVLIKLPEKFKRDQMCALCLIPITVDVCPWSVFQFTA